MNEKGSIPFEIDADIKKTAIKLLVSASNRFESETAKFISDPSDAETVHQMRLEIRKIRSILYFIKKIIRGDCYNAINGKLKQFNSSLAAIRDLDILVSNCKLYTKSDNHLTGIISTERTILSNSLLEEILKAQRRQKMLLFDWPDAIEWDHPASHETVTSDYVRKELSVLLKSYLKLAKKTDFSVPDQLHRFRIAGKKIKNIMELFLPILTIRGHKLYRKLKKILQSIGDIHDFNTSRRILTELSRKDSFISDEANKPAKCFRKIEKKKTKYLNGDWHRVRHAIKACIETL